MSALGGVRTVDEIVVVDDGSSDRTLSVARSLANAHSCVTVATEREPGGAAAARLRAARLARNEWIALLDSDDYLSPDAVSGAYDEAISQGADVCVWSVYRESGGNSHAYLPTEQLRFPMTGREATRLTLGDWRLPAVGVMRRSLFIGASESVNVNSFNVDELISRALMLAASRVVAGPGTYFYVDNVDSTTRSITTDRTGLPASHQWLLDFAAVNGFFKEEPQLAAVLVRQGLGVARRALEASDTGSVEPSRRAEILELIRALQVHAPPAWRCGPREVYRGLRGRSVRQAVRALKLDARERIPDALPRPGSSPESRPSDEAR